MHNRELSFFRIFLNHNFLLPTQCVEAMLCEPTSKRPASDGGLEEEEEEEDEETLFNNITLVRHIHTISI